LSSNPTSTGEKGAPDYKHAISKRKKYHKYRGKKKTPGEGGGRGSLAGAARNGRGLLDTTTKEKDIRQTGGQAIKTIS